MTSTHQARSLQENFKRANEKRFAMEKIVSEGSFGVTIKMKVKEKAEDMLRAPTLGPKRPKYFIMKRSLRETGRQSIRNEIGVLEVCGDKELFKHVRLVQLLMVGCRDSEEPFIYHSPSESMTRPKGIN